MLNNEERLQLINFYLNIIRILLEICKENSKSKNNHPIAESRNTCPHADREWRIIMGFLSNYELCRFLDEIIGRITRNIWGGLQDDDEIALFIRSICEQLESSRIFLKDENSRRKNREGIPMLLKCLCNMNSNQGLRKFIRIIIEIDKKLFKLYGEEKEHIYGLSTDVLHRFEYLLGALTGTRDHLIHSFNVYLLGFITNLYLFVHKTSPRVKYFDGVKCLFLPLSFSWLLTAKLHDVGYIYERENLLKKAFPQFYEFINISDPGFLFPVLDKIFYVYGKIVAKNVQISCKDSNKWLSDKLLSSIAETFELRLRNRLVDLLMFRGGIHGAVSAYITLKLTFRDNPFSLRDYWSSLYYEPVIIGAFAQLYHSIVRPPNSDADGIARIKTEPYSVVPLAPYPHRSVLHAYSYIPILLLIFDEVVEFGRPSLRRDKVSVLRTSKKRNKTNSSKRNGARWYIQKIELTKNGLVFEIRDRPDLNTEGFFETITSKLEIIGIKKNSDSMIIELRGSIFPWEKRLEHYYENMKITIRIERDKGDPSVTRIKFS